MCSDTYMSTHVHQQTHMLKYTVQIKYRLKYADEVETSITYRYSHIWYNILHMTHNMPMAHS